VEMLISMYKPYSICNETKKVMWNIKFFYVFNAQLLININDLLK